MKNHPLNNTVILHDGTNGAEILAFWKAQEVDTRDLVGRISGRYYGLANGIFDGWPEPMVKDLKIITLPYTPKPTITKQQVLKWDGLPEIIRAYIKERGFVGTDFGINGFIANQLAQLEPEAENGTRERFFVDSRAGCIAVRDRLHPSYDPTYPGLHFDTSDVIFYAHGTMEKDGWVVCERDIEKANKVCDHLNGLLPSEIVTTWTPVYRKPSANQ